MTLNFEHHEKFDSIFYSWYYKNIIYPPESHRLGKNTSNLKHLTKNMYAFRLFHLSKLVNFSISLSSCCDNKALALPLSRLLLIAPSSAGHFCGSFQDILEKRESQQDSYQTECKAAPWNKVHGVINRLSSLI